MVTPSTKGKGAEERFLSALMWCASVESIPQHRKVRLSILHITALVLNGSGLTKHKRFIIKPNDQQIWP